MSPRFERGTRLASLALGLLAACGGESRQDAFGGGSNASTSAQTGATSSDVGSSGTGGAGSTATGQGGEGAQGGGAICTDLGDPCTTCEATQCAAVYCDCYSNVECGALAACAEACGYTPECYQQCATEHPEGISEGALLTHCAGTVCSDACPGYQPLDGCQICLYTECQPEMNDCVSNPDCTALLTCLDLCETPECTNDCYFEFPDGSGDVGPVGDCLQESCAAACG